MKEVAGEGTKQSKRFQVKAAGRRKKRNKRYRVKAGCRGNVRNEQPVQREGSQGDARSEMSSLAERLGLQKDEKFSTSRRMANQVMLQFDWLLERHKLLKRIVGTLGE